MSAKTRFFYSVCSTLFPLYVIVSLASPSTIAWYTITLLAAVGLGWVILTTVSDNMEWSLWGSSAAAYFLGIPIFSLITVILTIITRSPFFAAIGTCVIGYAAWLLIFFNYSQRKQTAHKYFRLLPGILLSLTALAVFMPYLHVGIPTESGFAYRAYFDHDFLVHLAVSAELSHGEIPPQNPYFNGTPLHYYWLPFQFPAACYNLSGCSIPLEKTQLLTNLITAFAFILILSDLMLIWFKKNPPYSSEYSAVFLCAVMKALSGSGTDYSLINHSWNLEISIWTGIHAGYMAPHRLIPCSEVSSLHLST